MIDPAFAALGDARFISLTTFRRSGEAVSTPVWIARDGEALVVTTPADSGKVKRLRNSGRVELRPSSRSGKVGDGVVAVAGHAEILSDPAYGERLTEQFRRKYGLEYRVVMAIERVVARRQKERVMLRITPTG